MTRRRDQSLQQSPVHDPRLKETVPSAEMQEGLFDLLQVDVWREISSNVALGRTSPTLLELSPVKHLEILVQSPG